MYDAHSIFVDKNGQSQQLFENMYILISNYKTVKFGLFVREAGCWKAKVWRVFWMKFGGNLAVAVYQQTDQTVVSVSP